MDTNELYARGLRRRKKMFGETDEAQEGIVAFNEKRSPSWTKT